MGGLSIDAFRGAVRPQGPRCTVAQIRAALAPKEREAVDVALADAAITSTAIARVLSEAGHQIKAHVVQGHRRGDCRCEKDGT